MGKKGKAKGRQAIASAYTPAYFTRSSSAASHSSQPHLPAPNPSLIEEDLELSDSSDDQSWWSSPPPTPSASHHSPTPSPELNKSPPPSTPHPLSSDTSSPPPPPASNTNILDSSEPPVPPNKITKPKTLDSSHVNSNTSPQDLRVICTCASEHLDRLKALSPAVRARCIYQLVGNIAELKVLPSGDLLIINNTMDQVHSLLQLTEFAGIPVRFYSPSSVPKRFYGVISGVSVDSSEDDLRDILQATGATEQLRLRRRSTDGSLIPTTSIRLTFSSPPPDHVLIHFVRTPIRPYTQRLLQCYKCHRYGHSAPTCHGKLRCGKCAAEGHAASNCSSISEKCPLCSGLHTAWSPLCTFRQQELQFERLRAGTGLSYREAKLHLKNQLDTIHKIPSSPHPASHAIQHQIATTPGPSQRTYADVVSDSNSPVNIQPPAASIQEPTPTASLPALDPSALKQLSATPVTTFEHNILHFICSLLKQIFSSYASDPRVLQLNQMLETITAHIPAPS